VCFWVLVMKAGSCVTVYLLLKVSCSCSPQKRLTNSWIWRCSCFVLAFVMVWFRVGLVWCVGHTVWSFACSAHSGFPQTLHL